jgi:hypothetical protein
VFEIGLGMALPQVDGEIGDPLRVHGVAAERTGAERAADPAQHLGGGGLDGGPDPHREPVGRAAWVGVDLGGGLGEHGAGRAEGHVDRAEVGERVRADVLAAGGGEQGVGHPERAAVPAGGHADAAVPEAGPVDVLLGAADRSRRRGGEAHGAAVAAGHADRRPRVVERPCVRGLIAYGEEADPVAGGRRDESVRAPARPGAPGPVAGQQPAVPGLLRPYRRRSRRPDAPALPSRGFARFVAQFGADGDGVGVPLAEAGRHQVGAAQGGETPQAPQGRSVAGKWQIRNFDDRHAARIPRPARSTPPFTV